ncbi:mobilization protein, partial [Salmonella enterica subsp. enterica serovar Panama]
RYPWNGKARWMVLRCRCDGETIKNGRFSGF